MKSIINGVSTYYPGRHYNLGVNGEATVAQKTYAFGSMTIAVRTDGILKWLLADHLGSTSITANEDGSLSSEIRYSAFGEARYSSGTTPTSYQYTNQLNQPDIGLYYYVARFYDPVIAHFVQADTIVPGEGNPVAYDRYAYTLNNPIRFNDASGHFPSCNNTTTGCLSAWNAYGRWASNHYASSANKGVMVNNASTTLHPAAVKHQTNINEESYDDSGNKELDNKIGLAPVKGSSAFGWALLIMNAVTQIATNEDSFNWIAEKAQLKPSATSNLFYQEWASGLMVTDPRGIMVQDMEITNYEPAPITDMRISVTIFDRNNLVVYSQWHDYYEPMEPMTVTPIRFEPPIIVPESYRLSVDTYLSSNGREGKIHQELTP